ncbi:MAG: hypothetical protein M3Q63_01755 [bacterium]|nr:hypothetical protein [bacterium]
MEEKKKTTEELITSLYTFIKGEFKSVHKKIDSIEYRLTVKIDGVENNLSTKIDKVAGLVSGHEGRISGLEDSMRVVKTKLGLN